MISIKFGMNSASFGAGEKEPEIIEQLKGLGWAHRNGGANHEFTPASDWHVQDLYRASIAQADKKLVFTQKDEPRSVTVIVSPGGDVHAPSEFIFE